MKSDSKTRLSFHNAEEDFPLLAQYNACCLLALVSGVGGHRHIAFDGTELCKFMILALQLQKSAEVCTIIFSDFPHYLIAS